MKVFLRVCVCVCRLVMHSCVLNYAFKEPVCGAAGSWAHADAEMENVWNHLG